MNKQAPSGFILSYDHVSKLQSMKGKNLTFIGTIVLLTGILMILFRTFLAAGGIVLAVGLLFVAAGLLNMSVYLGAKDRRGHQRVSLAAQAFGWIVSVGALLLGLSMLLFSKAFVALVGFMFGVLILLSAIFQIITLLWLTRPTRLSNFFFLVPVVLIGIAIFIFMREPDTNGETTDMLLSGTAFVLFGAATIAEGLIVGNNNRNILKAQQSKDEAPKLEQNSENPQG